jgi:hypothetical protein
MNDSTKTMLTYVSKSRLILTKSKGAVFFILPSSSIGWRIMSDCERNVLDLPDNLLMKGKHVWIQYVRSYLRFDWVKETHSFRLCSQVVRSWFMSRQELIWLHLSAEPQTVSNYPKASPRVWQCLCNDRMYVICWRRHHVLTISRCLHLLSLYVAVLYASIMSTWPFRVVCTSSAGTWGFSMLPSSRPDHFALSAPPQGVWYCYWFFI